MKKIIASILVISIFTFNYNIPCSANSAKNNNEATIPSSVNYEEKQLEQSIINTLFKLSHNKDFVNVLINNYNKSQAMNKSFLSKVKKWSSSGIGWILKKTCSIIMKILGICVSIAVCAFILTYVCKKFIKNNSTFKLVDRYIRIFSHDKS